MLTYRSFLWLTLLSSDILLACASKKPFITEVESTFEPNPIPLPVDENIPAIVTLTQTENPVPAGIENLGKVLFKALGGTAGLEEHLPTVSVFRALSPEQSKDLFDMEIEAMNVKPVKDLISSGLKQLQTEYKQYKPLEKIEYVRCTFEPSADSTEASTASLILRDGSKEFSIPFSTLNVNGKWYFWGFLSSRNIFIR